MKPIIDKGEFSTLVKANRNNRHAAIIHAAVELFASSKKPSNDDKLHFEELCLRLLPKLSLAERAEIAEKLSTCPHMPRSVALQMSEDDLAVAQPILEKYRGFNDDDLLVILARCDEPHALSIASRPELSDKLICGLSGYHITQVLPEVGPNPKMEEPMQVEEKLETLPALSNSIASDEQVDDMDLADLSKNLSWILEAEHAHVLTHLNHVEKALQSTPADPATLLSSAFDRAVNARDFITLLRRSDEQGFADLLAKHCKLTRDETSDIVDDEKGFALILCLKSLALPKYVANEAAILLNESLGKDIEQIYLLDWFYDQISPAAARHVVHHWQSQSAAKEKGQTQHVSVFSSKSHGEARPSRDHKRDDKGRREEVSRSALAR